MLWYHLHLSSRSPTIPCSIPPVSVGDCISSVHFVEVPHYLKEAATQHSKEQNKHMVIGEHCYII